jgi:hypothetical protein
MIDVLSGNPVDEGAGNEGAVNGLAVNGGVDNGKRTDGTETGVGYGRPAAPQPSLGRFGVASPDQLRFDPELPAGPRQRRRRRRWPWALSSVAVAGGLCAGSFMLGRATKPEPPLPAPPPPPPATAAVVALAHSVTEGQPLSSGDLTVVTIVIGPGTPKGSPQASTKLPYFPASREANLVGRRVRSELPPGALLLPAELSDGPFPAKGQALVGMDLQPSEAPTGGSLAPGDQVGVLFVPAASQPPYPAPEPVGTAQVVASVPGQSGDSYVSVVVPAGLAARVAAYAQHNEVALVRLGPGEAWRATPAAAQPVQKPAQAKPAQAKPAQTTASRPTTAATASTAPATTVPDRKKSSPRATAAHGGRSTGKTSGKGRAGGASKARGAGGTGKPAPAGAIGKSASHR